VTFSPDGTRAYVTNANNDSVTIIDTATNTVTGAIYVGDGPQGVAVSPDGAHAITANSFTSTVSVITFADRATTV
jgi:YVTN family beta-propeller protein